MFYMNASEWLTIDMKLSVVKFRIYKSDLFRTLTKLRKIWDLMHPRFAKEQHYRCACRCAVTCSVCLVCSVYEASLTESSWCESVHRTQPWKWPSVPLVTPSQQGAGPFPTWARDVNRVSSARMNSGLRCLSVEVVTSCQSVGMEKPQPGSCWENADCFP